jgi:hypothetical protein
MRRETTVQLIAGACLAGFLLASSALGLQIASSTGRNRLVHTDTAEKGDPPQVALGVAMGAFRGLFVNYLWIRANELKEAGKYYEAVDLAKTITRLQPRFPKVWQFHAWNLAYNISVSTQTPSERWQWVQSGVRLLRNEGIPANPADIAIHRELAWIHLHKIQGVMDDAHRYYKKQFALEWTAVMGSPPALRLDEKGGGTVKQRYLDRWLRPIAEAPASIDELYERFPQARELVAEIKSRAGLELDRRLLERFALLASLAEVQQAAGMGPSIAQDPLGAIMLEGRFPQEVGRAVINFTRRRVLITEYNMEPERMIRYTEYFGPLDWRHPAAHAVYWSARGSEEALLTRITPENRTDFDVLNTDRLTMQAVQELFRTGTLVFDITNPGFYLTLPNVEFIDTYRMVLEDLRKRSDFDAASRAYSFYSAGYENFMKDAVRYLYRKGEREKATQYRNDLIVWENANRNDPYRDIEMTIPIDEWVQKQIVDDNRLSSPVVALQEISGALFAAYTSGLLAGDSQRFINEFNYARVFHAEYQKSQGFQTWVTEQARTPGQGRLGFPEFDLYASQVLAQIVEMAGLPQGPIMFRRAPADLQARAFVFLERGRLREILNGIEKEGGPGFAAWFPEPPGAGVFREQYFGGQDADKGRTEVR